MTEIQHVNPALNIEKDPLAGERTNNEKGFLAFQQTAPDEAGGGSRDRINPNALFSLFTADIIEKNKLFVR